MGHTTSHILKSARHLLTYVTAAVSCTVILHSVISGEDAYALSVRQLNARLALLARELGIHFILRFPEKRHFAADGIHLAEEGKAYFASLSLFQLS